jgi:hypothetical protein
VLTSSHIGLSYVWPVRTEEVFVEINIEVAGKEKLLWECMFNIILEIY